MTFSIVIAVKNAAKTLAATLDSVFAQSYPHWEIIVQDGGSTDGTLDILNSQPCVAWRSEPDTGIYDAWNKAARRVAGDWVLFLGADDRLLHRHALVQCRRHLSRVPDQVVFAYGALLFDERDDAGGHLCVNRSLRAVYARFPSDMGLPFPATFVRASLLRRHAFDASYAIAGDYAFAARLVTGSNVARLPVWVSFMRRGGVSDSPAHAARLCEERARVLRECVAPRAAVFAEALAGHRDEQDIFLESIPEE